MEFDIISVFLGFFSVFQILEMNIHAKKWMVFLVSITNFICKLQNYFQINILFGMIEKGNIRVFLKRKNWNHTKIQIGQVIVTVHLYHCENFVCIIVMGKK